MGNEKPTKGRTVDQSVSALKAGGKVELGGGVVESMDQNGDAKRRSRRQSEHHVPLPMLDKFVSALIAKYGNKAGSFDITIEHQNFWATDDMRVRLTEYLDLAEIQGDYAKVFA